MSSQEQDIIRLTKEADLLLSQGDGDAAASRLKTAVQISNGHPMPMRNLAYLYRSTGHYGKALATYEQVAELDESAIIRVEMANCLVNLARPTEARAILDKLMLTPQGRKAGASAFLMAMLYDPETRPEEIRKHHEDHCRQWRSVSKLSPHIPAKGDLSRNIRVGYLTADFYGDHPVAQFLAPILHHHADPAFHIESRVYNTKPRQDETANRMDKLCIQIDVQGLDDQLIAERMREDKLDILVDLSGHTSGHRLKVIGAAASPHHSLLYWLPLNDRLRGGR